MLVWKEKANSKYLLYKGARFAVVFYSPNTQQWIVRVWLPDGEATWQQVVVESESIGLRWAEEFVLKWFNDLGLELPNE